MSVLRHCSPFLVIAALTLGACEEAKLSVAEGMGANPTLPQPRSTMIPTVKVAKAKGWADGASPTAAPGLMVKPFAAQLDHPRWLYVLPNGDVLVAKSNAPPRPGDDGGGGIRGWFMKQLMARAGAKVESADRITLLRDVDGDGVVDSRSVFLEDLHSPFGMTLVGETLYVANADSLMRFPYKEGETRISGGGVKVIDLPGGPINHHWTKNVVASRDGSRLYVSVGSNSNVGENGIEAEANRAAIWEIDPVTGSHRIFASGLRNPVGMAWEPVSGQLWTAVNERDELGSDLVPDYMTSVKDGAFYGWPYSYYGQHMDERVTPQRPDLVAQAVVPDYALGPHTASLGLTFAEGAKLTAAFGSGAFVGQHGSWNRRPPSGYKVIYVPFQAGRPAGAAVDVLTGFLTPGGEAQGRPVGVAIDRQGSLLVADDVGNVIWRVSAANPSRVSQRRPANRLAQEQRDGTELFLAAQILNGAKRR